MNEVFFFTLLGYLKKIILRPKIYWQGEKWYEKMCKFTLCDDQWGSYNTGVVSSSGIGDGSYKLLVAKHNGMIVGIAIDF